MSNPLLSQKETFDRYIKLEEPLLSSWAFVNVFGWQDFFRFEFKEIQKRLCVFAHYELGCFLYLPPLGGPLTQEILETVFEYMDGCNKNKSVSRIENIDAGQVSFFDESQYKIVLKAKEYVYRKDNLLGLKGNAFKSKRSELNQFCKNYAAKFLPYEDSMLTECLALYENWAGEKRKKSDDKIYLCMLEDNRRVHERTMRQHQGLGLVGRVVLIDGRVEGYTFGFALNAKTFCVLFEVVNLKRKGLANFIFHEFCCDAALAPYSLINVMDDFGLENISRVKMSYRPSELVPTYTVSQPFDSVPRLVR